MVRSPLGIRWHMTFRSEGAAWRRLMSARPFHVAEAVYREKLILEGWKVEPR